MSKMVEKIARQICGHNKEDPDGLNLDDPRQKNHEAYAPLAELALKAIRKSGYDIILKVPTSEMTPTELNDIIWSARWKQSTVARMSGCTRQNVNHWVKGRSPIPDNVACIMENVATLMERLTGRL